LQRSEEKKKKMRTKKNGQFDLGHTNNKSMLSYIPDLTQVGSCTIQKYDFQDEYLFLYYYIPYFVRNSNFMF
jgi:hypothetical protein